MNPAAEAVWEHLRVLAGEIGPRVLGTEGDRRAAAYIERRFQEAGLEVLRDVYPCPSWEAGSTRLCILPDQPADALANMFSPPGRLVADLTLICPRLRVPTAEDVADKVVLATDIPGDVLVRNRLAESLEQLGAAALVGASSHEDLIETKFFRTPNLRRMPVLCVSHRTGESLARHVGSRIRVEVECRRFDSESCNIVARKPGAGPAIAVGAHYDTAPSTPGATDNGSGTSVLIELARRLAEAATAHPFEFIAFGGEEYGGTDGVGEGARQYARLHADHFRDVRAMMAIDDVGSLLGGNCLHYDPASAGSTAVARLAEGDPHLTLEPHLTGGSDHVVFWQRGVPAVWLASRPLNPLFHTPADDLSQVDRDRLGYALESALRLSHALDQAALI
jgi:aminopeptidase YwaD